MQMLNKPKRHHHPQLAQVKEDGAHRYHLSIYNIVLLATYHHYTTRQPALVEVLITTTLLKVAIIYQTLQLDFLPQPWHHPPPEQSVKAAQQQTVPAHMVLPLEVRKETRKNSLKIMVQRVIQ